MVVGRNRPSISDSQNSSQRRTVHIPAASWPGTWSSSQQARSASARLRKPPRRTRTRRSPGPGICTAKYHRPWSCSASPEQRTPNCRPVCSHRQPHRRYTGPESFALPLDPPPHRDRLGGRDAVDDHPNGCFGQTNGRIRLISPRIRCALTLKSQVNTAPLGPICGPQT